MIAVAVRRAYFESMSEQWPVSEARARPALPSVDDLPKDGDGYEPEAVHEAFDAFYRHIAQLDATLQTLEAVEAFSRQAGDLRDELRAFRRARWEAGWNEAYGRPPVPAAARRQSVAIGLRIGAPHPTMHPSIASFGGGTA